MDLSIIIVSYNACDILKDAINSIIISLNNNIISYEIIIIDNNSNENNRSMISNNFPWVKLISNRENIGFAKANNQGINISKGNYLLLINPDTIITKSSIPPMLETIKNDPKVGLVAPKFYNNKDEEQFVISEFPTIKSTFARFCLPRIIFNNKLKKLIKISKIYNYLGAEFKTYFEAPILNKPTDVKHIPGACMLLRRELIEDIGLLDENIFMYLEDTDYSKRASDNGWRVVYVPASKVIHIGGASSGGDFNPISYCRRAQSANYYFSKHHNKFYELNVRIILIFSLMVHLPQILYHIYKERGDNYKFDLTKLYIQTFKNVLRNSI